MTGKKIKSGKMTGKNGKMGGKIEKMTVYQYFLIPKNHKDTKKLQQL